MTVKFDLSAAARMYESGMSTIEIGRIVGRDASNISVQLRKAGCKMRRGNKKGTPCPNKGKPLMKKRKIDYEKAAALYKTECSLKKVAAILGCNDETVRNALRSLGVQRRPRGDLRGPEHAQYKGGYTKTNGGYIWHTNKGLGHRLVAEAALGRPLLRNEVVHHVNCDKLDNRPSNLLICTTGYHTQLHARMRKHPYWSDVSRTAKAAGG